MRLRNPFKTDRPSVTEYVSTSPYDAQLLAELDMAHLMADALWMYVRPNWRRTEIAPGVTRCPTDPDNTYPMDR